MGEKGFALFKEVFHEKTLMLCNSVMKKKNSLPATLLANFFILLCLNTENKEAIGVIC